ncbi:MAG: DUF362 domain-containing protein [Treponema sp.]|nr:DUF362 domain-containing protein [Treponema sp.]
MDLNEIMVVYGSDPSMMAQKLAEAADLASLIGDRNRLVGLKPNLVVSRPASGGATTHPEIAAGLIAYLKSSGFKNIVILEGSWTGDSTVRAFARCGYSKLSEETGVKLIDTQTDTSGKHDCMGMEIEICDSALRVDFMINIPVLKGHCQTLVTCALKNTKGLIPDREKRRFHILGLHKPIAHLNAVVRSDFIVVDGICGDPDFEEGGNPVYCGRLAAARDPVLCDSWAAAQLGYNSAQIPYIGFAEELGLGSADLTKAVIRQLSSPKLSSVSSSADGAERKTAASGKIRDLAINVREENACSSCYAVLVSALLRMNRRELEKFRDKGHVGPVSVGQGFRGKKGSAGIGFCTASFAKNCPGCPPSGAEVLAFLRDL